MTVSFDLGFGHRFETVSKHDETDTPSPHGIIVYHKGGDKCVGDECGGYVTFRGMGDGRPEWDVLCSDPLTLDPSILCHCGEHGWIREGKWVPA